jgi:pyranose oxidase
MNPTETVDVDVLIIGSGPVGCTFARKLIEAGRSVFMVDAGALLSRRPGEHLKNSFLYQRNINLFASVIRGHLHPVSVPVNNAPVVTLDPGAYRVDRDRYQGFVRNNQNPDQNPYKNLDGAAVTYAVGGMTTHWTCATPRQHPTIERMSFISPEDWDRWYSEAEQLLNTHSDQFDTSIRHTVVRDALQQEFKELRSPYQVQNLPLAVQRREDNDEFVQWSATDTVLGPLAEGRLDQEPFILKPQHRCKQLQLSADRSRIDYAVIENLMEWKTLHVHANVYVLAVNAMLTPQVLFNSGIHSQDQPQPLVKCPALGRYLAEQPLAFCQIVLRQDIVDRIAAEDTELLTPALIEKVKVHKDKVPNDPVPIPMNDPEPQVWIPVSKERPWHCQIHRDAFNYGDVAPNVDDRLIVDLRWFGMVEQRPENRITFSEVYKDAFGMPQPTFEFQLNEQEGQGQHRMIGDLLRAARTLGGFLPGSEPQFMPPGLPLHVHGTIRMGMDPAASVVNPDSQVWGINNLYLGGNGLLSVGNASNPTLTSVALALKAAAHIIRKGQ